MRGVAGGGREGEKGRQENDRGKGGSERKTSRVRRDRTGWPPREKNEGSEGVGREAPGKRPRGREGEKKFQNSRHERQEEDVRTEGGGGGERRKTKKKKKRKVEKKKEKRRNKKSREKRRRRKQEGRERDQGKKTCERNA